MKSKLISILALLCASVMGWAGSTPYCGTTITAVDGTHTASFTCKKLSENSYAIIITSNESTDITGYNAGPLWMHINGSATYHVGEHFTRDGNTVTANVSSSTAPDFYTSDFYFYYPAEVHFILPINDIDFTATCSGGSSCTDETAPTVSSVSVGSITYNSATLTITASDNEGGSGIAQYIVKNGDTQIASSASNVIALTGLTPNTTYNNIKVFAQDACNNESSAFTVESFSTQPRPSECEGSRGHEGGTPEVDFVISYDGSTTTLTATPKGTGIEFDFFEIKVNNQSSNLMGGEDTKASVQYTTNVASNTELYIAFLYSLTSFAGNHQTTATFQTSSTDPNIIYYKVGDCTTGGAVNPNLTLTNPTKSSVLLPKDGTVTVTYTSDNDAAATIASEQAYVSISGNVVTAESTGTATVTVSQAAVEDTWKAASVSFEVNAFDWNDISFIASSDYKFKASSNSVSLDNAILSRSGHNCIHLILPNAVGLSCSLTGNHEFDGAGLFIYTDVFTVRQTPFTVTCDGNTYDCYVYYNLDETAPTISNVAVTSYTHESAVITITANETFVSAEVFNNGVSMGTFTPSEGAITITGLSASTTYNQLTVKVKDAANNWSSAANVPEFTTAATPSITPVTYNGYCTNGNFFVKYAITRTSNSNLAISANIEWLPTYSGVVAQIWRGGDHINLSQSGSTFTGTFLSDLTDGDVLSLYFRFEYALGATGLDAFSYTVGSEQAEPDNISVGAVALNKYASTLSVGGTDNLSATAYPSFATNAGAISWNSDATSYATVDAGTVTAIAAGSANITATCGGVTSAPCVVMVVDALEEARYYGCGGFANNAGVPVSYEFAFTRATNNNVRLDVVFSRDMSGIISSNNFQMYVSGQNRNMTYDADTKTASYDFGAQDEDAPIPYYFYFVLDGGGLHQTTPVNYIVGSSNEPMKALTLGENENNAALLVDDAYFDKVIVGRTFATNKGHYTLVLPFDLDEDAVAAKLPGTLTELKDSYLKPNEDLKLNFVDVTSMTAGKAYLYLPSQAVANPVFENVTIKSALVTTDTEKADFIGIYAPMTIVALQGISNSYVLGADNYLYESSQVSTDGGDMKALRAYFTLDFQEQMIQGRRTRAMVVFNEPRTDMPTGVEEVEEIAAPAKRIENGQLIIEKNGRLYNAQGQVIR